MTPSRFRAKILREIPESQAWLWLLVPRAFKMPEWRQKLKLGPLPPWGIKIWYRVPAMVFPWNLSDPLSFLSELWAFKFCRFVLCGMRLYMVVSMCVCTYMCIACVCTRKPEVDIWSLPWLLSTIHWGKVSQLNPELWTGLMKLSRLLPWSLKLPWWITQYPAFMWVLGIQTSVLTLTRQLLYPLSHFPVPMSCVFWNFFISFILMRKKISWGNNINDVVEYFGHDSHWRKNSVLEDLLEISFWYCRNIVPQIVPTCGMCG